MFYAFARFLIAPLLKLFFRFKSRGVENAPIDGAVVYASSHKSYIDPVVVAIGLYPRRIRFMAKAELWKIPVLGRLIGALGAFPVERGRGDRKAIVTALEILKSGGNLLIFPEGTRIRREGVGEGRRGVASLAMKTGALVVPVGISGVEKIMPEGTRLPRFPKVEINVGKPLDPAVYAGDQEALSAAIMREIARLIGCEPGERAEEVAVED